MCLNFNISNPQASMLEKSGKSEKVANKNNIDNQEVGDENNSNENISSLAESDISNIDNKNQKKSEMEATTVSFSKPKNSISEEDNKISEIISSMKDNTMKAVLDAFDRMLDSSRRMREANEEWQKKVGQPQKRALEKAMDQDFIKKEILQESIFENQIQV